ncbi:hypothetical protein JYU12_00065 [bacterium AH-315-K03]|nr:hypothetical protein [bacterium AH-315-K03]
MKNKKNTRSFLLGLLALLVLMATAMGILIVNSGPLGPVAFFAHSMDEASYDCEDKINKRLKSRLISKHFDNFSSRYDVQKRQYLIFYRLSIRESTDNYSAITERIAKCIVWERLGYVSDFRIMEL